jgi:hypothetical protein
MSAQNGEDRLGFSALLAARGRRILRGLKQIGSGIRLVLREFIHPKVQPIQTVTSGRIEMERDGERAYLEYSLSGRVLELIHTEVPRKLRGIGLASSLAKVALDWARKENYRVDIICPYVGAYVKRHPEYLDLVMR